jgi:hypothetical protein
MCGDADVADEVDVRHVCLAFLKPAEKGALQLQESVQEIKRPDARLATESATAQRTGRLLGCRCAPPVADNNAAQRRNPATVPMFAEG